MSANRYRERRDLEASPEPAETEETGKGFAARQEKPIFVIQEHAASQRHFDFRVEIDGSLVSWAIPKGPSTDPSDKRLAVRVEDHPLAYADFEGRIPDGEYGAGAVVIWDRGTYRNLLQEKEEDEARTMKQALDDGKIEVWLEGEKLEGGWALVQAEVGGEEENWLFIKLDDEKADARRRPTSTQPESVVSGKSVEEIADEEKSERE